MSAPCSGPRTPSTLPSCSPCAPSTTGAKGRRPTRQTRRARYHFADLESFRLPVGCRLVGIEITDDAIDLPTFRHPRQAAYILGAEREGLSKEVQALCDYVVKIPMRFSVNLGVAGALVMYDRLVSLGRHAPRPVAEGGPTETVELPAFGEPMYKRRLRLRQKAEAKQ
jgi:SpoU rRNA Methylase family